MRIIGGTLRGSKLAVPAAAGLRPTPDRVRETLFNWLIPVIDGASCLDLFAGTGALGIEALSRGAARVTFVERDVALAAAIDSQLLRLQVADRAKVRRADACALVADAAPRRYDIVFLDPPFDLGLWQSVSAALEARGWLSPHAFVYVETPLTQAVALPPTWQPHREKTAGQVRYALYARSAMLAAG